MNKCQEIKQKIKDTPKKLGNLIGIESTSKMDTSLAKNVPVINVRPGSLLDTILPGNTVTIYPLGVFTNTPMTANTREEEGFHWKDQSTAGPFVPVWYACYGIEYAVNLVTNGGNSAAAHDAISFERNAMGYANSLYPTSP